MQNIIGKKISIASTTKLLVFYKTCKHTNSTKNVRSTIKSRAISFLLNRPLLAKNTSTLIIIATTAINTETSKSTCSLVIGTNCKVAVKAKIKKIKTYNETTAFFATASMSIFFFSVSDSVL